MEIVCFYFVKLYLLSELSVLIELFRTYETKPVLNYYEYKILLLKFSIDNDRTGQDRDRQAGTEPKGKFSPKIAVAFSL